MTAATIRIKHRLFYFACVGAAAASLHLFVVFLLVSAQLAKPLLANLIAFFAAFNLSYLGHRSLTFSQLKDNKSLQLSRFFIIALSAALLNEGLYFLFLHYTRLNYLASLFIVISLVSIYTFTLSRCWACSTPPTAARAQSSTKNSLLK